MIGKLLFIDTETTGLKYDVQEVIEFAGTAIDPKTLTRIDSYETKILPQNIENADERALMLNHYSAQAWAGSPLFSEVAPNIAKMFGEDVVVCGHNVTFDIEFINSMMSRNDFPKISYYGILDTKTLAKDLKIVTASYRLTALCSRFGIEHSCAHSAGSDVSANVDLFRYLHKEYSGDFTVESVIVPSGATAKKRTRNREILALAHNIVTSQI